MAITEFFFHNFLLICKVKIFLKAITENNSGHSVIHGNNSLYSGKFGTHKLD